MPDSICGLCGQWRGVTANSSQAVLIAELVEKRERIDALVKVREVLVAENARLKALLEFRGKGAENA